MNNTQERYCFDTNCFIEPWNNFYSYKSHKSYWDDFVLPTIQSGGIVILEEVYREINKKDDELSKWFKANKSIIGKEMISTDTELTLGVQRILSEYPRLSDNRRGRSIADPFLIEYARKENITLVTLELLTKNLKRPKIPDVCEAKNVSYINLYKYIEEMGLSFKLEK